MNAASALATMPAPFTMYLPKGFSFSAAIAGIKVSGRPDLAWIEAPKGTTAAALFTQNRVVAAPVQIGRASLAASHGRVRGVLVNSGNANCATGAAGLHACKNVCREAGKLLGVNPNQIFPSSTGIIGVPFPEEKVINALPALVSSHAVSSQSALSFADAILTTDTRRKIASAQFTVGKAQVNLLGFAKGSGMIHPNMATMLVYILTDIKAGAGDLKKLLREACAGSFNSMSVDGDTSTNDTVLLLASGSSGIALNTPGARKKFSVALNEICASLADQIVSDGEGVQHVIRLHIEQAKSREEGLQIARAIAHSLLVKTAWAGADPNWGRILSSVGNSGVPINPARVSIFIGKQMVCKHGGAHPFNESQAHSDLSRPQCDVRVQLGRGKAGAKFTTTDLTAEYVRINADYST